MTISNEFVSIFDLQIKGSSFVGEYQDYLFSCPTTDSIIGQIGCRFVFTRSITNQELNALINQSKTKMKLISFAHSNDTVIVYFPKRGLQSHQSYAQATKERMNHVCDAFSFLSFNQFHDCCFCQGRHSSEEPQLRNFDGYLVPLHDDCAEDLIEYMERFNQSKR